MILRFLVLLMLFAFQLGNSQTNLSVQSIPEGLKENANAVVREDRTDIVIGSRRSMVVKSKRVVTIFNEYGLNKMNATEYYDGSTKVRSVEAVIYNASGQEIKKIRKKDFKDQSVSEGSVLTDNRVLYLDYTPVQYPFTLVYTSETETSNTAFMPTWSPVTGVFSATEKAMLTVTCPKELGFRYKDYNFNTVTLNKEQKDNSLVLSVENIPALKPEDYTPYKKILPYVLFSLEKFHLEGVDGEAADWAAFGAWYNTLLAGTDELPQETVAKIKGLVGSETDPLKKAKIVYEYMQGKTRYISIQLGIGGWKPMKAKDVDRLGYGDCKALSNYTRALLKAVGVDSYCAVIYGDTDKRDIREDFVSMQGNHMILGIPVNGKVTWLECTSQQAPFGFQGDFTDDRLALLIKPDKGELVRTRVYDTEGNTQFCKGVYKLTETGALKGSLQYTSKGTQYDDKYLFESRSADDLSKIYKSRFSNINNVKIGKTVLKNNKDVEEFTEDLSLEAESYASKSGNRLIFTVNAFNQFSNVPQRYRSRKMPFSVERGWIDTDEIAIELPQGYSIEAKPEAVSVKEKFGEYTAEYIDNGKGGIIYKRSMKLNSGYYQSNEYEDYRAFREKIAKLDNAKIILVKN